MLCFNPDLAKAQQENLRLKQLEELQRLEMENERLRRKLDLDDKKPIFPFINNDRG